MKPLLEEGFDDTSAAVCHTQQGMNNLAAQISGCTTSTEADRNNNFATTTLSLEQDITSIRANVTDSLSMGDSMFGQFGHVDITHQVKERNRELKLKKENLVKNIKEKEARIRRADRDFSDVKDTIEEPQKQTALHFIEDYTLAILSISYLFMMLLGIYMYISNAAVKSDAIKTSLIGSVFITMFSMLLLNYLA